MVRAFRLPAALTLAAALFSSSGAAAEDRGAWFKSLKQPLTGASCCDISDCRAAPDAKHEGGQWWATVDGEMTPIPNDKILKNKWSFDGAAYVCSGYGRKIYCFIPPDGGV